MDQKRGIPKISSEMVTFNEVNFRVGGRCDFWNLEAHSTEISGSDTEVLHDFGFQFPERMAQDCLSEGHSRDRVCALRFRLGQISATQTLGNSVQSILKSPKMSHFFQKSKVLK